jgi:phosphatidylglycerophosphatase A
MSETRSRPSLLSTLVATSLGAGFLPLAPGTWGTLVAVPIAWALGRVPWALPVGAAVVTLVGVWAADRYVRATGEEDNQEIVVDEVAGYLVTMLLVPRTLFNLAVGFVLFRVFDVWKPPPARTIDRRVKGGIGVMADDLVAGAYGALVLLAIERLGVAARLKALW